MGTGQAAGGDALAAGPSFAQGHLRWIARRLAVSVVVLVGVSLLVFAATQALPSDPAVQILGRSAAPEQLQALREELGLDRPLVSQYLHWSGGFLRGSLGDSLATREPVSGIVGDRALNSFALVLLSALIAVPLALLIGTLGAVRRDRPFDHVSQIALLVITSIPEFVVGLLLLILLSTTVVTWLPAVAIIPPGDSAFSHPRELVLPVATLVLVVLPYLARLHRAAMVDVLASEYVQMARLKGLPERVVIRRHALRNALVPAVQGTALTLVYLTGSVVTIEYLFAYPGLGSALAAAVQSRDLPVAQGIILLFAATYVVLNLVADLLTVLLSPRLRTRS